MKKFKPTVVFDFDGVIHSYTSGWKGESIILDPPVPGIKEVINELKLDYNVVIVSTRCSSEEGREAIKIWLNKHNIEVDGISKEKPPAIVYIDDRAIQFTGKTEGLVEEVKNFNKKHWLTKNKGV